MLEYSIREVSELTGIKDFTLRTWEKRYNIAISARTENNTRIYSEADVQRLRRYAALISRGFKISEVVAMTQDEISCKLGMVFVPKTTDLIVKRLMKLAQTFSEKEFDKELKHVILETGLESAVITLIVPMMEMMEALCIQDSNYLAIKQFTYDIVRRRLIVAADIDEKENGEKILLFSPLEDSGELSLLIADYMLKKYKLSPIYCGDRMKINNLLPVIKKSNCTKVMLVGRLYESTEDISGYVEALGKIEGIETIILDKNYPTSKQINCIQNIEQLREYLKK